MSMLNYTFIRDIVTSGSAEVLKIPTANNLAYMLPKVVP